MFLPINRWRKLASRAVEHNEVSPVVVLVPVSTPEEEYEHAVGAILARTSIGEYSREPTNAKRYLYYRLEPRAYTLFAQSYDLLPSDRRLPHLVSTFNSWGTWGVNGVLGPGRPTLQLDIERGVHRYNEVMAELSSMQRVDWMVGPGELPHPPEQILEVPLEVDEYGVFRWYSKSPQDSLWASYRYRGPLPSSSPLRPLPALAMVTPDGLWHQRDGKAGYLFALGGMSGNLAAWKKEVDRVVRAHPTATPVAIEEEMYLW